MKTYKQKVETEFEKMQIEHERRQAYPKKTQKRCVLEFLLENQNKVWWWAWEFYGKTTKTGRYLSHRAAARASDLAIHYPDLVEHRKIGRFKVYRLRVENMKKIKEFLQNEN